MNTNKNINREENGPREASFSAVLCACMLLYIKIFNLMRRMCNAQFKNLVTLTRKEWQPENQEVQLLKVTRLQMEINYSLSFRRFTKSINELNACTEDSTLQYLHKILVCKIQCWKKISFAHQGNTLDMHISFPKDIWDNELMFTDSLLTSLLRSRSVKWFNIDKESS